MIRKLVVASVLACAASASQAAVVDVWSYEIDMAWVLTGSDKPVFAPSTHLWSETKATSTLLSWGSKYGVDDYKLGTGANSSYARSSLYITNPQGAGSIFTDSSVSMVNMFRHTNNAINASFADLLQATMNVSVALSANGSTVQTFNDNFKIYFYETPNEGKSGSQCSWGGNCDDDLFAFVVLPEIYKEFTYDGMTYQFNYFQTSGPDAIQQFDAATCNDISRGILTTTCYGFRTSEYDQTTLKFGFSISAVPEPETYAMLLAGLGMLGVVVRRRRHTIHN
ncbi:MAG: THxN family PEP-CTERM protein [Betaproteobacteria bacterium]|nr:THxN family PEP-CTERM protein [Betaproteobacteria bacterium]